MDNIINKEEYHMPQFIRLVNKDTGKYGKTLLNVNHINRINPVDYHSDLLEVTPISEYAHNSSYYVFKKDLMDVVNSRIRELIKQITEK